MPSQMFVQYEFREPTNANRLCTGEGSVVGMWCAVNDGPPQYFDVQRVASVLEHRAEYRRVYWNALLSQAAEHANDWPLPREFDDVRSQRALHDVQELSLPPTRLNHASPTRSRDEFNAFCRRARLISLPPQALWLYHNVELPVILPTLVMIAGGVRIDMAKRQRRASELMGGETVPIASARNARADDLLHLATRATRQGQVHPMIEPLGTCTGRFSVSDPPLQALNRLDRDLVIARPGRVLIEVDIDQFDIRSLAAVTRDSNLMQALSQGQDIHRLTARGVLGKPLDAISKEERNRFGKQVILTILNGGGPHTLCREIGISASQAETILRTLYDAYPQAIMERSRIQIAAEATHEAFTLYGRRGVFRPDDGRDGIARRAFSHAIQGTSADVFKLKVAQVFRQLVDGRLEGDLVFVCHDSLLIECEAHRAPEVAFAVRQVMEEPVPGFEVPLRVHVSAGPSWGEQIPIPHA